MGLETDVIRYNVTDRRRQFVGTPRNFNVNQFVKLLNGQYTQEMVKKRDLVVYLGHDIRRQFGLNPPETTINGGQLIPIEPAFVTTYLKAFPDGTVEHRAEFLDTPLGKKAQEWHLANMGGFSSVVAPNEQNPTEFWGFDYVRSPNFHGNRGYAVMDSTAYDLELNRLTSKQKYQEIAARQEEQQAIMDALFQAASHTPELLKVNSQLAATIESLSAQLDDVTRERDECQAALDDTKSQIQPMVRLSVSDNWLNRSLSVMDNIAEQNDIFIQTETRGLDVLQYLRKDFLK